LFPSIVFAEDALELVELLVPELAHGIQPLVNFLEPAGLDTVDATLRVLPDGNQPRFTQYFEVLGYRRPAHFELIREIAEPGFTGGERLDDLPTRRVGECNECVHGTDNKEILN
jgi:hypothetical protein